MVRCGICAYESPDAARYCGGCAAALEPLGATRTSASPVSSAPGEGRFAAGTLLAGRYRIIELVGRGGMGEVYKAHDAKLDQVVALKFLPESLRQNASALVRLHGEVRIARQISHPNVCRVYDIGEAEGLHFLLMEFIDGENLGQLLKRIGRFPHDKGVEIARKLCGALAAAHDRGILHRDLKPANIMLNAAGQVMVADFGLAGLAEQLKGDAGSGTPAYMAPEQIEGREVTARSDIYALGLVLYEIFTGRRAFADHRRGELTNPSSVAKDIDPAVERLILRCVAENPADRPASALAVAKGLPGGDPLEAALAAGETPSPEMVAAAGETSGISVRAAVLCMAGVIVCLILGAFLVDQIHLRNLTPLELPPEALAAKAREIASSLGYRDRPMDTAFGFAYNTAYVQQTRSKSELLRLRDRRPTAAYFWYRESPWLLGPVGIDGVKFGDPPATLPGMISMQLETAGRLALFQVIPPVRQPASEQREADWNALFSAAGLEMGAFEATPPDWNPPMSNDVRRAWKGTYPEQPDSPIRLEAAGLGGRAVYFRIVSPWMTTAPTQAPARANAFVVAFQRVLLLLVCLLAWRNFASGRGDRRGAFRIGVVVAVVHLVYRVSRGDFDHSFTLGGRPDPMVAGTALFWGFIAWAAYFALEPMVRRKWPQSLVSWTRLLAGRWRDPLLGRDILLGVLAGSVQALVIGAMGLAIRAGFTRPGAGTLVGIPVGAASVLQGLASQVQTSFVWGLLLAVLCVFLWLLVRNKPAAAILAWALISSYWAATLSPPGMFWVFLIYPCGFYIGGVMLVLLRFGVTASVVSAFAADILILIPGGLNLSAWYQNPGQILATGLFLLAVYGFYNALGGRRVLGGELFGGEG